MKQLNCVLEIRISEEIQSQNESIEIKSTPSVINTPPPPPPTTK